MKNNKCCYCLNHTAGEIASDTGWYHSCKFGIENEGMGFCDVYKCEKYSYSHPQPDTKIEYINKEKLVKLLYQERELFKEYGYNKIESIKMLHGTCCCCAICGRYHDECVCMHNWWIKELEKITESK